MCIASSLADMARSVVKFKMSAEHVGLIYGTMLPKKEGIVYLTSRRGYHPTDKRDCFLQIAFEKTEKKSRQPVSFGSVLSLEYKEILPIRRYCTCWMA